MESPVDSLKPPESEPPDASSDEGGGIKGSPQFDTSHVHSCSHQLGLGIAGQGDIADFVMSKGNIEFVFDFMSDVLHTVC